MPQYLLPRRPGVVNLPATRCSRIGIALPLWILILLIAAISAGGEESGPAARIVHLTGQVEVLSSAADGWHPASAGAALQAGDSIRTGDRGWAALLVADETMIQLNRNSFFTIKSVIFSAGWLKPVKTGPMGDGAKNSLYELNSGQLWLRNKNKAVIIDIRTPLLTAGIRGTEFDLRISADGAAYLSVLEGRVLARNEVEETVVNPLEQVIARAGGPLEKRILLTPENTVQWVVHLPPLLSADLPGLLPWPQPDTAAFQQENRIREAHAALLNNDPGSVETMLSEWTKTDSPIPAVWIIYAQSLLLSGKNQEALLAAKRAVELSPHSIGALITKSYAHQALFQLKAALDSARQAVRIAPENETARVTAARLWFALDDTNAARAEIAGLSEKGSASLQNLLGFISFAEQDTKAAVACFEAALAFDPGMAESYLGLALARMRLGEKPAAVAAIAAAMVLEPRRSLFLSYWGKMLHELGRPEKALDILAQAAAMDPADPTPWLYRAHILSDLNQAGEAIEALNEAILRNDNRAVYRSRFLLDKDLAVKNVSLARLFRQLGMGDWGQIKAWKSVKLNYANSAAHDFWAWTQYYLSGGKGLGDTSEWLKAFLFKPANANTFNTVNDYTLLYEQPDVGGSLELWAGNHDLRHGSAVLHGAAPEQHLSYQLDLLKYTRDQWRGGLYEEGRLVRPSLKWDITPRDHLSFRAHLESVDYGDTDTLTQYHASVDRANKSESDYGQVEFGYYRHMSAGADFLMHLRHRFESDIAVKRHQRFFYSPNTYDFYADIGLEEPYTVFQLLQLFHLQNHQVMLGTFQYWSDRDYDGVTRTYLNHGGIPVPVASDQTQSRRTRRQQSYYFQDIWELSSLFSIEGALYADTIENVSSADNTTWSDTFWNPRVGLQFTPGAGNTVTLAFARHLDTLFAAARIDPIDVVGNPLASLFEGSVIEQWALGWQHEWPKGAFLARLFDQTLDYDFKIRQAGKEKMMNVENHYQGIEISYNQLLTNRFGLNLGYILVHVEDDESDAKNEGENQMLYGSLAYLHPRGFYGGLLQQHFVVHYDNRPDNPNDDFNITTAYIGYELPKKRGDIRFEVINLFNEHFDGVYLSDLAGIWPETAGWLSLKINF
ncbi:MAG: tetratricopeptide repeat protein [Pseudomonadota bacterium]